MSDIEYQPASRLLDAIKSAAFSGHVCVFPSISLKSASPKEQDIADIYNVLPYGNYYQAYSRTNKMAKPGTFSLHADMESRRPPVINMYYRLYPGSKVLPNDNPALRSKWFGEILTSLTATRGFKTLHMEFPDISPENIQQLEDFVKTYKLNWREDGLKIVLYNCTKPEPAPISAPAPIDAIKYVLNFRPEQLVAELLYEVDFVKYKKVETTTDTATTTTATIPAATTTSPSPESPKLRRPQGGDSACVGGTSPLLALFPSGWDELLQDKQLCEQADLVWQALSPVWDSPELFPAHSDIFNAFAYLGERPPQVLILGQDPYHGVGQAHGLSFSVNPGIAIPPSLRNIYKALENDADLVPRFVAPKHGNLRKWAEQGVIMLNSSLTVLKGQPNCHAKVWERFTDRLIQLISSRYSNVAFVLWGAAARAKKTLIASNGHLVLEYNHPSPMVKNNDFATGCKHFSQINGFLLDKGQPTIDWSI